MLIVSGTISGKTETATIYIFSALEERLEAQAHVVALVLATVSIVLLIGIEWLHRRNELARSNTYEHADQGRGADEAVRQLRSRS